MFSGMGPARSCLMISWLWIQIKDGGLSAWGLRHETSSMALLVWSSATWDAKLKFIEAAPTDRFAGEEVDQSGSLLAACCWCQSLLLPAFLEIWPNKWASLGSHQGRKALPFTDSMKKRDLLLDFRHFMNSHKRSRDGKPPLYSLSSFSLY